MITSIRVKNLALVDDISIDFHNGLNILTGETGAGKSILMNSISLCLGEKANKSLISKDKDFALVEVSFSVSNGVDEIINILNEQEITYNQPNDGNLELSISRKIGDKNVCKVNGEIVNLKTLQSLSSLLVDTHAQHETSKLLNPNKHIEILDQYFGFNSNNQLYRDCEDAYRIWSAKRQELKIATQEKKDSARELSIAEYEVNEIETANLQIGEDEEIENKYKMMRNSQNIFSSLQMALNILSDENSENIQTLVGKMSKELSTIAKNNEKIENLYNNANKIEELLSDLSFEMSNLVNECQFSQEDFEITEKRLNLINSLKNRYGSTIEDILTYLKERQEYIDRIANYDEYVAKLEKEEKETRHKLAEIYKQITEERTKAAQTFSEEVTNAMLGLNFNNAQFRAVVTETTTPTPHGRDKVEFMTILNKGTSEQPLASVASGGELSRVMLAIKSIVADKDNIETLIFDEIDSGISGNTAWMVGERLFKTSIGKQILCITHLPQIAAFADNHYIIEKNEVENKAITNIVEIDNQNSLEELKRLSGVSDEKAINELKDKANAIKEKHSK